MTWQHWLLLFVMVVGAASSFLNIDEPREPRDIKDAGAGILFSIILIMLLIWGQQSANA